MMNPLTMAIAAITIMLWILWSDSIRSRRPTPILYAMRIALYLIVSGIFVLNMIRYPRYFAGGARVAAVLAVVVGILGAFYFGRKMAQRR